MLCLRLSSSWIPCRVIIHKPNDLLIPTVDESDLSSVSLDGSVDCTAGVPELGVEAILDQQKLSHNEDLDQPAHEVQRKSDHAIRQKGQLDLAFPLIDVELIVPDDVSVTVDAAARELDFDELQDSESEEEDNRSVIEVVNEAERPDADVEQVLAVVVHHRLGEVLFVELRGLADPEKAGEGGGEGDDERVLEVKDAHHEEERLEDRLNDVKNGHFGGWRRSWLLLIHWC